MPRRCVTGWMLVILALAVCRPADAGGVRVEKRAETLKHGGREAVIKTPVFRGIDPAVLKTIQESVAAGVRDATGSSPEEWKAEDGGWLTEIDYEVTYNDRDLLSLAYVVAGMGAYPNQMEAYVVLDMKTGRRLAAEDVFRSLEKLAAKMERLRAAAVKTAIQEFRPHLKENEMTEEDLAVAMEPAVQSRFTVENLNRFRLDEKGVTFVYDFGFPHVSEALEPSGEYFVSWEELRPYVRSDGPLARLVG